MSTIGAFKDYFLTVCGAVTRLNRGDVNDGDEIIEAGDFHLNVATRTAVLRGTTLELTASEFDLLVFLVNHPKHLVTPQTKLTTGWASSTIRQTEFLKTLASLRKKLESQGSGRCYIRTEPWVFYRFDVTASAPQ